MLKITSLLLFVVFASQARDFVKPRPQKLAEEKIEKLNGVGISEKLGTQLDLNLEFTNEENQKVKLSHFFNSHKPIMISLAYFGCSNLCNFHLNGVFEALQNVTIQDYKYIVVSFDPNENFEQAIEKKKSYLDKYFENKAQPEIYFLTGDQQNITKIADQFGFTYQWDEQGKQWAHSSAVISLSPQGIITRYLHGILFEPKNLKLSLLEASKGKVGTIIDKVMLYCFRYDIHEKKYTIYASKVMKAGAGFTVFLLIIFIAPYWIRQRRKNHLNQGDK